MPIHREGPIPSALTPNDKSYVRSTYKFYIFTGKGLDTENHPVTGKKLGAGMGSNPKKKF
jgi:hypothetical protein